MANAADLRAIASVKRAISRRGRWVALEQLTTVENAAEPWKNTETSEVTPIKGLGLNYKQGEIDGTLVHANDIRFIFSPDVTVTQDMKVTDKGVEYSVVSIENVGTGDTLIMQKVQLRV